MTTLRQRASNWLMPRMFPGQVDEMARAFGIMEAAYVHGKILARPEQVLQKLQENGRLTDLLTRLQGSTFAANFTFTEADRVMAVKWATFAYATNVNIESAVQIWTDFGMGQNIKVTSPQPAPAKILDEFWTARRNRPVLGTRNQQDMSTNALNEGEVAFALWFSPIDGLVTIREVKTLDLEVIWQDEDAKVVPLFYIQKTDDGLLYYPDWLAPDALLDKVPIPKNARRTDRDGPTDDTFVISGEQKPQTQAVMLWANRNKINGRGTPQFKNGLEFAKILQQFFGDRAAVSRKAAMYTENVTADGGSRVIDQFQTDLGSGLTRGSGTFRDSNPPPAAASDWIQNLGTTREWQDRDTGATSARFDGQMFAGQLGVSTRIALHWAGFPGALNNRSTAEETKIPFLQAMKRYKSWWESVFDDMGRAVLKIMDDKIEKVAIDWEKVPITVTMETPINVLLEELALIVDRTIVAADKGVMDIEKAEAIVEELLDLALTKIGATTPKELLEPTEYQRIVNTAVGNFRNGDVALPAIVDYLVSELAEVTRNGV